jgi:hypothetical protein
MDAGPAISSETTTGTVGPLGERVGAAGVLSHDVRVAASPRASDAPMRSHVREMRHLGHFENVTR